MSESDAEVLPAPDLPSDEPAPSRPQLRLVLRALGFASLVLGVVGGLHVYVAFRLISGLRLAGADATAAWALAAFLFFFLFASFFARALRSRRAAHALRWSAYLWMGAFPVLLTSTAAVDLATALASVVAPAARPWSPAHVLVTVTLAAVGVAWGVLTARGPAKIERTRVPVASLGAAFDGFRIVQISDIHVGETIDRAFAQRMVEQVNALQPDAIAITGDLADGTPRKLRDQVAPLAGLRARHGVFYVTGNHEFFYGASEWEAEMRRLGITVLHNEHRVIARGSDQLVIAGVVDFNAAQFEPGHASRPDVAFEGAPAGAPRVLLAHQPRSAFDAAGHSVDLQLSGHTHGGQLVPWMAVVRLQQPALRGLKTIQGVRVYTHRGTGYWGPPVRLGASPEIAEFTLVRAAAS